MTNWLMAADNSNGKLLPYRAPCHLARPTLRHDLPPVLQAWQRSNQAGPEALRPPGQAFGNR